ncbi:MAG: hypothetical protein K8I27_05115 [Planctomycetes bacterium]|nr:hypothetical protein [Planctomycetota bacterium]
MHRNLLAVAAVFSITAVLLLITTLADDSSHAQDRVKEAQSALQRADAAFEDKKYASGLDDYRKAADDLPPGENRNRAVTRLLVSLAEGKEHQKFDELNKEGLTEFIQRISELDARVTAYRMAGMYFATRDHDYHDDNDSKARVYQIDMKRVPKEDQWRWRYVNLINSDLELAKGLLAHAHENSRVLLDTTEGQVAKAKTERHVAITLEYCDLLEVTDRLHGKTRNDMYFFGSEYGVGGPHESDPEPETEEFPDEEPVEVPEATEDKPEETFPDAAQPSEEPFTRRGYFLQPTYGSLPTINALIETASHHAKDLNDKPLQASILYRRAMLMINAGLYGNAELNAKLTDWRNPKSAEPDIARDPRPLLRKILSEHKDSIWDDEARFLLGYVAYYLNNFDNAAVEFAKLEKDFPKSRYIGEARRLTQVIEFPQLFTSFSTGKNDNALVAPGQPLNISVFARNVDAVRVSLRPLDLSRVMAEAVNAEHVYGDLAEIAKLPGFEQALGVSVMDQTFALNPDSKHFYHSRNNLPLYTSTPGVFLLEVSGGPVLERKLVQIADLAVQRRRLGKTEQFWVTTRDGRPLNDVLLRGGYFENLHVSVPYREEVAVDENDPGKGTRLITRFREERRIAQQGLAGATDANGLFETSLPAHGLRNFWATLDVNGTLFLINDANEPREIEAPAPWMPQPIPPAVTDIRSFVYTDRPVYRPGDTAWLRVIARLPMGEGQLEGEPVLLRVLYDGVEQYREEVRLNDFGCATARFDVPFGSPVGNYQVLVSNPRLGGDTSFRLKVLEYFKKDIKLTVEAPKDALIPGSNAEIPVVFSYLAGGNVQGGEVEYVVRARSADGKTWQPAAGRGRTNLDGRLMVALDTAQISKDANGRAVTLTIDAEGRGPGGQTVHAQGVAKISGSGISVRGDWPDANWNAESVLALKLRVTDSMGRRQRATGTYTIWRITDETGLQAKSWRNPSIKRISSGNFDDAARHDSIAIAMPRQTGRYYIEVEGDANDDSFELTHSVLHISRGELDNRGFEALPEYDDYDLTRPVRVLVAQQNPGPVLISLHADGRESDHKAIQSSTAQLHSIELTERNAPHVHLSFRAVRNGEFFATHCGVKVRPADRLIRTTVRFDKEKYRPGDQVNADIFTVDYTGQPVPSEVTLSVWDSALKEFADSALEDTNLYDHFFSGTREFIASDLNLAVRTRVKPTRASTAKVKRWTTFDMPIGSFFYGAQSWSSMSTVSLREMLEDPGRLFDDLRVVENAKDSMNADWERMPPTEAPTPYYGESAGGIGGGGGRGGKGGFSYRRARGGGGRPHTMQDRAERRDFRDSAYFNPAIRTNDKGVATVSFKLPDNLTEWTFEATAADRLASVGQTSGTFTAARDLGVRVVGPRGLTEGDEVELCALVQNLGDQPAAVSCDVQLNVEDPSARLALLSSPSPESAFIEAGSSQEVRFRVKVSGVGETALRVKAFSDEDADSLVWHYTVSPRGMPVTTTTAFRFDGKDTLEVAPELPQGAVIDRSSITVQFNGSMISSLVDALPGLVHYPHGCAEQTTNKFVPLLSVLQLLKAYKVDIYEIGKVRVTYDGVVENDNWPAQLTNPLELQRMVDLGFGKLREYQNDDGGWGWFGRDGSNPHLSAIVLAGLCSARETAPGVGLSLPATDAAMDDMFARGARFLLNAGDDLADDPALRARGLHAASWAVSFLPPTPKDGDDPYAGTRKLLTDRLVGAQAALGNDTKQAGERAGGSAGLASLALALHKAGRVRDAKFVINSLLAQAEDDGHGGLVFPSGSGNDRRWHDHSLEAHALAIRAIASLNPTDATLDRAVRNLLASKRGGGWGNTRATGQAIGALAVYLDGNPEQTAEARVRINYAGANVGTFERTSDKLLSARTRWDLAGATLKQGASLTLTRSGSAPISGTVTVRAFMPIEGEMRESSNGLKVTREYFVRSAREKEVEVEIRDERGNTVRRFKEIQVEYDTSVLREDTDLKVGDVITVQIIVQGNKGERYICIEDARPSCLEPISSRFDVEPGRIKGALGVEITKEERDTSTNFYATEVDSQGRVHFRYDCVVVASGKFTALPARAFDMYDEARNGHSSSTTLKVE